MPGGIIGNRFNRYFFVVGKISKYNVIAEYNVVRKV